MPEQKDGSSPTESPPTDPSPTRPPPTRLTPAPTPPARTPPPVVGEVPRTYLDPVVADAADRAGIDTEAVAVTRSQAAQWPDGSLGCPQPGQMYTQAVVDGYWIELNAGGVDYDYRLDGHGSFRLCTGTASVVPPGPDRE